MQWPAFHFFTHKNCDVETAAVIPVAKAFLLNKSIAIFAFLDAKIGM